jgi:hypothetical protein
MYYILFSPRNAPKEFLQWEGQGVSTNSQKLKHFKNNRILCQFKPNACYTDINYMSISPECKFSLNEMSLIGDIDMNKQEKVVTDVYALKNETEDKSYDVCVTSS